MFRKYVKSCSEASFKKYRISILECITQAETTIFSLFEEQRMCHQVSHVYRRKYGQVKNRSFLCDPPHLNQHREFLK